jgi:hypothetical protein
LLISTTAPKFAYVKPASRRRVFAFLGAASPNNYGTQRGKSRAAHPASLPKKLIRVERVLNERAEITDRARRLHNAALKKLVGFQTTV